MVVEDFKEQGYPADKLLRITGLARSSYYYKSTGSKAGKRKSSYFYKDGMTVSKEILLEDIKELLSGEFVDYGYFKTYKYLKEELGYSIGSTRTYRIMKDNNLLKFQRNKGKSRNRNWVKELVPNVEKPFQFFEFDIKFVYVQGNRTNAMILTVLDVYSRWNMGQYIAYNIGKEDVIQLFEQIISRYKLPANFIVRNDNGSQFIASIVQEYFVKKGVSQEFTKPATPEQNAHIESYHSIMENAVCQRFEFENLKDLKTTMSRFRKFYNFERIHGGLGYLSPLKYLKKIGVNCDNLIHE